MGFGELSPGTIKISFCRTRVQREKIYTGREIEELQAQVRKNYIVYDPKNLQQTAKEEIYRADERSLYINSFSDRLVFAYDDSGALFKQRQYTDSPKFQVCR